MKIAFIFDGIGFGGIERVGIDYIKMLQNQGNEITVYNLIPAHNEMETELGEDTKIIHQKMSRKACPYAYSVLQRKLPAGKIFFYPAFLIFSIYQKIRAFMKQNRTDAYDVAIAFSGHYNDLTFLKENYVKANKKIAWLHGGLADYAGVSFGFLKLYECIGNLVCLSSDQEKETILKYPYLKDVNIRKIYNPTYVLNRTIDETYVTSLKEKYGDYLLMVGRFTNEKDHKTVIDAVRILKEQYKLKHRVVFVGDGFNKAPMENYAREQGVDGQVIFEGNRIDVQNYYKAATLYVHSSPAEGLPTVLIESMCFGLPIVATDSRPGVPEVLEDGKDGIICPVGDASALAEKIHEILNNKRMYQEYQEKLRVRMKEFQPEIVCRQIMEYLQEL